MAERVAQPTRPQAGGRPPTSGAFPALRALVDARGTAIAAWAAAVLVPFLASRFALAYIGYLAVMRLGDDRGRIDPTGMPWVNAWSRHDGMWYVSVAEYGYGVETQGNSNLAFAPLLPMLMKAAAAVFGRDDAPAYVVAGLVVSNLALIVALTLFLLLARLDHDEASARRGVLYLLLFPTTLFLSALYPESLFLALTLGSFYCARRRAWVGSGVLAAVATLARPHGLLLALPLAIEYLAQRGWRLRDIRLDAVAVALPLVAHGLWLGYLALTTGDPFASYAAQAMWGRRLVPPWVTIANFFAPGAAVARLDLIYPAVMLLLVIASWKLLRPSYAAYAVLFYLLPLSSAVIQSQGRFALTLFPAFLVLALAGRSATFDRVYVLVSSALAAFFMALFAVGGWVG